MLAAEARGRDAFINREIMPQGIATRFVLDTAKSSSAGQAWSTQQQYAAIQLLSSPDRVTALQGLAGTAKTTSVLTALAEASKAMGHEVRAMAPTTDVARELGRVLRADEGVTLAKHLADVGWVRAEPRDKGPVWIVDEGSMVSAKDMRDLIRAAEQHDARLFLVFDVLQLGSVGAGRAAGQLIEHGMRTAYLDQIVRQAGNTTLRDAVYDMIAQNPGRALQRVLDFGGTIIETGELASAQRDQAKDPGNLSSVDTAVNKIVDSLKLPPDQERALRVEEKLSASDIMAQEYVRRSPAERAKTIVIDPTRNGVHSVTASIRHALAAMKELTGNPLKVTILEEAGLTERERATPTSYRVDQLVRFGHAVNLGNGMIPRGSYLKVADVSGAEIVLKDDRDRSHRWEPRARSLPVEVYDTRERDLMVGDRIRWTRNIESLDVVSGRRARVLTVDEDKNRIQVQHDKGGQQTIDLGPHMHRHFDHGYALTMQRAQGATGPVIAHLRSHGLNTVHLASAYGALSRSPDDVVLVTDSKRDLVSALRARDGEKEAALDQVRESAGQAAIKVREMAMERQAILAQEKTMSEASSIKVAERSMGGPSMER